MPEETFNICAPKQRRCDHPPDEVGIEFDRKDLAGQPSDYD